MVDNPRQSGEYWKIAAEREASKCVFCDLRDKYVIVRQPLATLTINTYPYIDGQMLIVPNRHVERLAELTEEEILEFYKLTLLGQDLLKKVTGKDDVWVLLRDGNTAGKTVKHLHQNIMPYVDGINTWNYQDLTIKPVDMAKKLRGEK